MLNSDIILLIFRKWVQSWKENPCWKTWSWSWPWVVGWWWSSSSSWLFLLFRGKYYLKQYRSMLMRFHLKEQETLGKPLWINLLNCITSFKPFMEGVEKKYHSFCLNKVLMLGKELRELGQRTGKVKKLPASTPKHWFSRDKLLKILEGIRAFC